ncbi:MAG: MFS transporter [Planctomycetales bacterium]|nr:MFS transporter [Planctomycetales bacterium]
MTVPEYTRPDTEQRMQRTELVVLAVAVLASSMAFIDATALNVALPQIQTTFAAAASDLLLIVNSYGVVTSSFILIAGSMGDRYGREAIFMGGIVVFLIASIACGLSSGSGELIVARTVQGFGAAAMIPGSLTLIAHTIPPHRRGRAIGIWSASSIIMTALGPVVGGMLADAGLWRAVFWINVPLGFIAMFLVWWAVPWNRSNINRALDYGGALLVATCLTCINLGLLTATTERLINARTIGFGAVALLSGVAFIWNESRSQVPLLPSAWLRHIPFRAAAQLTLCFYAALYGMLFLLALNLVQVQGYSATQAGLAQLPLMVLVIILAPLAGMLIDRFGPRWPLAVGTVLGSTGFLLLTNPSITAGAREYATSFLPGLTLIGVALGLSAVPLSTIVMNSASQSHVGVAAAINSTLSRMSNTLGVAILGTLAIIVFRGSLSRQLQHSSFDNETIRVLQMESVRLLESHASVELSPEDSEYFHRMLHGSYVEAFRLTAVTAAIVVAASGAVTFALLRRDEKARESTRCVDA